MRRIEGLPETVSIESLTLRDDAYAVLCLVCGGGGEPATVKTCRGRDAKAAAWETAAEHEAAHARRRDELAHGERRRLQAHALGWSQAQADAMVWAAMHWLHYDGARFLRRDLDDPHVTRGRTVAKARVQALLDAGLLHLDDASWEVMLTADGRAALDAWRAAGPEPAAQESHHLSPLSGGEEEARRDAERRAYLTAREAEHAEHARYFGHQEEPEPAADPATCDHHRHVWLYVTADRITGRLGYYLTCACGRERDAYPGTSPAMNTGTASRPLGIREADTQVADFHADRRGYHPTGRWTVLDAHTKRVPVDVAAAPRWPAVDDHNRRPEPAPAVDEVPVTPAAAADQDDDEHAAWLDRQAAASGLLTIDGPGIVGPGTHITYLDGHGHGMRAKHGTAGTTVRIGRTAVTWRPYGSTRTLRTPLDQMRVNVPRTSATAETDARATGWRRWSLADHLAYTRGENANDVHNFQAAPPVAAQSTSPSPVAPPTPAVPAAAEPAQLPLWPTPVAVPTASVTAPSAVPSTEAVSCVVVIPCSGAKLDRPAPAGELYTGSLYTQCRKAADALTTTGGTVLVLSARHGLVQLDQVIAPYDLRIGDPAAVTTNDLRAQAEQLGIADAEDVTILAAAAYTAAARSVWPHAQTPLAGSRGIGQMRQRLAQLADPGRRRTA